MLTEDKQESLKDMLMQNLAECTNQIHKKVLDSSESKERSYDFLDLASFEIDDQMSSRIAERKGKLGQKIKLALEKLKSGDYGICEECGEEISHQRLMARPMASLCIDCKRKQEIMKKKRAT